MKQNDPLFGPVGYCTVLRQRYVQYVYSIPPPPPARRLQCIIHLSVVNTLNYLSRYQLGLDWAVFFPANTV